MDEQVPEDLTSRYLELYLPKPAPLKSASKTGLVIQPTVPDKERCMRALAEHDLLTAMHDGASSSAHINRVLHAASSKHGEAGPLLCLRCRVSEHIKSAAKNTYHKHYKAIDAHGDPGYEVMASLALTDDGKSMSWEQLLAPWQSSEASRSLPPLAFTILRTFNPDRAALSTWTLRNLSSFPELKHYLKQCGISLISTWALLAHRCSERRIREAYLYTSHLGITADRGVALWRSFIQSYNAEFADRTKPFDWKPDGAFWSRVDPTRLPGELERQLYALAQGVRQVMEKRNNITSLDASARISPSDGNPPAALIEEYVHEEPDSEILLKQQQDCALKVAQAALERALDHYMPAVIRGHGRDSERCRCLWQGYAEGLSQRRIAEQCGCSQKKVSVTLREQTHLEEIATLWALEIRSSASWAEQVRQDPDLAEAFMRVRDVEALAGRLRNQLTQPEQGTGEPPLRRWLNQYLHNH